MAAGNQAENGICALFVQAEIMIIKTKRFEKILENDSIKI